MTDNKTEIHSLQALGSFWKDNRKRTVTKHGSVYFVSSVEYLLEGKPPQKFQSVTILIEPSGYAPHISFVDIVPTERYHTKFDPRFQIMSLEGNVLIIKGSSQKMGNNYVVKVFCTKNTCPKEDL